MREGSIRAYIDNNRGAVGESEPATFTGSDGVSIGNSESYRGNRTGGENVRDSRKETRTQKDGGTARVRKNSGVSQGVR